MIFKVITYYYMSIHFFCIILILCVMKYISRCSSSKSSSSLKLMPRPTSYPLIGSMAAILRNKQSLVQWTSEILISNHRLSFILHRPFGQQQIFTADAANVEHILKSHSYNYPKGDVILATLRDFLGNGIFNSDGETWKLQRRISSHEFNTKSIRRFLDVVVDSELSDRLIPIFTTSTTTGTVLDFQDILHRFSYDTICKFAFGYDPQYLFSLNITSHEFVVAFDNAVKLITQRFNSNIPLIWKIQRILNIGSERKLKTAIKHVREFAKQVVDEKEQKHESIDLLSRFLKKRSGDDQPDHYLVVDLVISFILVGQNTISSALTWFFWLLSNNPRVENEILKELSSDLLRRRPTFDELRGVSYAYTHACLCESMRLYPPVPLSTRTAVNDDVLPDGTEVKKGSRVTYNSYAMGRLKNVWGKDWKEFKPERWLQKTTDMSGKWIFIGKDPYNYPLFGAGQRACLGKEMSILQMKRIVADILPRFKIVPAMVDYQPVLVSNLTIKMMGGFPVKIIKRLP